MRGLCAFLRQGFVVELARSDGVEAEVELIFPAEFQARLAQCVVAVLRAGMAFGEVGGVRGGKPFALQGLIWQGKTPFEIHEMRAKPVDRESASDPKSYTAETYTYLYRAEYGSPEVDQTKPTITNITVKPDGKNVRVTLDALAEGHVHEFHLPGVKSAGGEKLWHPAAYYTLNYVPEN